MDISRRFLMTAAPGLAAGLAITPLATASAAALGVQPDSGQDQTRELQQAIDKALKDGKALFLPAGRYPANGLRIDQPLQLTGIPGATTLVASATGPILTIEKAGRVTLAGIVFDGAGLEGSTDSRAGLVNVAHCDDLLIQNCAFAAAGGSGLVIVESSGRVTANDFGQIEITGLFALDSRGLEISGNHVHDIGNNGIQVWTSDRREDGTLVTGNRVERIAARNGGNGQNGNGINIYRAGNVTVAANRITDCAFSAIRNNSGDNAIIVNNSCSRLTETGIYVEFAFSGAVVSGNLLETVAAGISITNFNEGGRLAVCANNVVRDINGTGPNPDSRAVGIAVEADTVVTGNIIENSSEIGLAMGWGRYLRNINANGNIIRNCPVGIAVSAVAGAQSAMLANNLISGSKTGAILGMDHAQPSTSDLALRPDDAPSHLTLFNNLAT